jgi:expansin (peptidoglycan-binding protein)
MRRDLFGLNPPRNSIGQDGLMRLRPLTLLLALAACSSPTPGTDAGSDAGAVLTDCPASASFTSAACAFTRVCNYGQETCCGQTHPSITCSCMQQQFVCSATDACLIPACPDGGTDAGTDAGTDGGADAGTPDAGPCVVERRVRSGFGTSYTPGTAANISVCNGGLANTTLLRAAIAQPDFDGGLCGACALVTGDAGTAIVLLDDLCPGCSAGDLDFTIEAKAAVTTDGMNGRDPISWQLVPCPVTGNILVDLQGSNPFYVKLRLSNHRLPLAGVSVRPADAGTYTALTRTSDNFWVLAGGGPYGFPIGIRATDVLGHSVDLTLPALSAPPADTGGQFAPACAP